MTSKMAPITWWGITWFCYDTLQEKNNRLIFRNYNVFVFVLRIVSINPCTMHLPVHFFPDLMIPYHIILIINSTLGNHFFIKCNYNYRCACKSVETDSNISTGATLSDMHADRV